MLKLHIDDLSVGPDVRQTVTVQLIQGLGIHLPRLVGNENALEHTQVGLD
jgi:hypothetical protein